MRSRGVAVNYKVVARLMGTIGLKSKIRQVRCYSYEGEVGKIAPNVVARDFVALAPNRKWGADVTQINIGSTKLCRTTIQMS